MVVYNISSSIMAATDCCICMEATATPIQTPCGHNYCNRCLTSWLLEKDSCPMCRHEIGDSNSHQDDTLENMTINFTFTGDDYSRRCFRNAPGGPIRDFHIELISELIQSQINSDDDHVWATFDDPQYFEFNFRRKKMLYDMACQFVGKNQLYVEIDFKKVEPFFKPKGRNQKWVFKSKPAIKKRRNYKV